MMSDMSALILDTISFYIYSKNPVAKRLAEAVQEILAEEREDNKALFEDELVQLYAAILNDIMNQEFDLDRKGEISRMVLKYQKYDCVKSNPTLAETIRHLLSHEGDVSDRKLNNMERRIRNKIIWTRGNKAIRKMNNKSWACASSDDMTKQDMLLSDILAHARDVVRAYETNVGNTSENLDEIDMSNPEHIKRAICNHNNFNVQNRIKTGWQGLNRVLQGGFRRGEFVVFGALTHNFKSGILMNIARWCCVHNPPGLPPGVVPTILFISLENEIYQNMMQWFREAYINAYKKTPKEDGLTDEQTIDYVTEVYSKKGFRLLVLRKLGEEFGMKEFTALQAQLKENGYHVVATIIDYMGLMKVEESADNLAKRIHKLYAAMRDFSNHNGQTVFTAHQLDTFATAVANSGVTYIVKRFHSGHLSDCKAISKEADCLIFMHIEKNQHDESYLTMMVRKRRYDTDSKDGFVAYKFIDKKLGILDDIGGEDKSVTDIYSSVGGKSEEATVELFST